MWTPCHVTKYGVAVYNYNGDVRHGLQLNVGDTVCIQEECGGWYKGWLCRNKNEKGIFPKSFVHLKECRVDREGPHETVTPIEDSIAVEVAYSLREWATVWKKMYVLQKSIMFQTIRSVMRDLLECRRQLIAATLTQDQSQELKAKITNKIDWANRKLGLDLVPRIDSEQVDPERISPVELFNLHLTSAEQSQGASARVSLRKLSVSATSHIALVDHHLYVNIKSYGVNVGDESEISACLYDNKTSSHFSERYCVKYTKHGFPVNMERGSNCPCLFTDLGKDDLLRDAYLVVYVYRIGPMVQTDSKKPPKSIYKRPLGCAAMSVKEVLIGNFEEDQEPTEFNIKLYSYNSEPEFPQLLEHIIKKVGSKLNVASAQMHLGLTVQMKMLHGSLDAVKKQHPILFSKGLPLARKLGFPDVIMPGDVRNDLYLTLVRGEFERGAKSAGKNIEVRVVVIDGEGKQVKDAIQKGAGEPPAGEYKSAVFYHNNNPRWNETIKLSLPMEKFREAHFRVEFRHCSSEVALDKTKISQILKAKDKAEKKLFGFVFAPLTAPDGTVICDGERELYFYKCEEAAKLQHCDYYISLPSSPEETSPELGSTQGNTYFKRSDKEAVYIRTLLCSTKLTQNIDLIGLLNWRDQPDNVTENLRKLLNMDGEEIVKFLHDILESLFNMFGENVNPQLVFQALVHICSLLESSKFEHFKSVIDAYVQSHFAFPLVHRNLLQQMIEHINRMLSTEEDEDLDVHCKVLEPIFKFVVKSRQLCTEHFGHGDDSDFRALLKSFFQAIGNVVAIHFEVVTRTQVGRKPGTGSKSSVLCILLKNTVALWETLLKLLPPVEVTEHLVGVINRIPKEHAVDMTRAKLRALHTLVQSDLFKRQDCRCQLLPLCLAQLKRHLVQRQELRLCGFVLGDMLKQLHEDMEKGEQQRVREDLRPISTAMLDLSIQTMLTLGSNNTSGISDTLNYRLIAGQLVGCLIALLRLMDEGHYQAVLQGYKDKQPLKSFLSNVWTIFCELVRHDVFPSDWSVMRMVTNSTLLLSSQHFSQVLSQKFLEGSDFDKQLWGKYFTFAVAFLTQPSLQLEQHSEAKRDKIFAKYGDLRVRMGYEILSMWQSLGSRKIQFIPQLVGPFLQVTMVPVAELRKLVMPVFFDMMSCEQEERNNFKQVENELIDKLDILISENKGDDQYKHVFNTVLLNQMQKCPSWQQNGVAFIQSITRLMERLLDYRRLQEGEANIGKRMTCTVNLLNFYKDEVKREEMYLRYIYKLRDLHLACKNYTEAGFTLLVHAQQLKWTDDFLQADLEYPGQPEWHRKEMLYTQIIKYFDQGKSWEDGVPLCKELATFYESNLYNYSKLSEILKTQARFYDNILQTLRADAEYFRVGFYGQGFPPFLRNKMFIYRGDDYERLGSFTTRMQSEFHTAQLLKSNNPVTETVKMDNNMFLQICSVRPVPDPNNPIFDVPGISEEVLQFHCTNHVDTFQFDRPFHRGEKDKENEFKTLCIERTTLKTVCKLPGILRWFEVESTEVAVLSPIETAIDSLVQVNSEIQKLVRSFANKPEQNLNPLTMRLNGVIDAAVNGGITRYQQAFFTEEFAPNNPDEAKHVPGLKLQLAHQTSLLEQALSIHGKLAPEDLKGLHERLLDLFKKMKQGIRDSGSPDMQRLGLSVSRSSLNDSRPNSTASSKSSLTPTPPGSNRSSGFYGENTSDQSSSDSTQGSHINQRTSSDISIEASMGDRTRLSSAPSSLSVDSGLSANSYNSRSRTSSPASRNSDRPPDVPPRKNSVVSFEDEKEGSNRKSGSSKKVNVPDWIREKVESLKREPSFSSCSSPQSKFYVSPTPKSAGLVETRIFSLLTDDTSDQKTKVPPRVAPKPAMKRSDSVPAVRTISSPLTTPSPEAKSNPCTPRVPPLTSSRSNSGTAVSSSQSFSIRSQPLPVLEEHDGVVPHDAADNANYNNNKVSPGGPPLPSRPTPKPRKMSMP